jgi:hypothetical protein
VSCGSYAATWPRSTRSTRNTPARGFYEARGFSLLYTTDGADNEEREPDARYRWPGLEPRACYEVEPIDPCAR